MKTMRIGLYTVLCSLMLSVVVCADELTVAAAANLQFTLEELKTLYKEQSGIDITTVFGSSGKLTTQIENGAPFDVFMSADMEYPQRIYHAKLSTHEPRIYAYGHLVLWTMKDVDLTEGVKALQSSSIRSIAIAMPKAAPYGRQSVNSIKFHGLYPGIEDKLVYGESIAQVNQFITTQSADIGFTAKSIVLSSNMLNKGHWVDVDPASYEPIAQGIVILKLSQKKFSKEAQDFVDFIFTPQAQAIFKKYGYTTP